MLDVVEPDGLSDDDQKQPCKACPKCQTEFKPKRTNQRYCTKTCAKAATRNSSRGNRGAEFKTSNEVHYERAVRLREMIYSVSPCERLGVMKHILSFIHQDAGLRRILSDPKLLRQEPRADNKKNIAQAASAYSKMFFGVSITRYLEQVRVGTLNESHPVFRPVDHGPVPRLGPIREAKCWHKPLKCRREDSTEHRHAEDMQRVSAIVAMPQASKDAYLGDEIRLAANF